MKNGRDNSERGLMKPSRPRGPHSRELNTVPPKRVLTALNSPASTCGLFIQSCGRMAMGLSHVGNGFRNIAGTDWFSPWSVRISLHRNEPGSHAMQDCAQPFGLSAPLGWGVRHERQSRRGHVTNPGKLFTFEGNEDGRRC